MNIEALIFDLDGLLIDSERIYRAVSYRIADELGVKLHDGILAKQMARSPVESMGIFIRECGVKKHTAEELAEWRDQLMVKEFQHDLSFLPGAREILETFYLHVPLAIATGSPSLLLNTVVDTLNIRKFFKVLQPSDELQRGKPDPEIYMLAAKKLHVNPEACIVLEDTSNGSLAGKRAGCYVIAVPSIHTQNQDFLFVDSVAEDLFDAIRQIRILRDKQ